jgi:hypothetical protein
MNHEPNSHNQHQHHEELEDQETDTSLPLGLEALAARLVADGAVWQSRLPDAVRVAERIRAIPHDSLPSASEGDLPRFADTTGISGSSSTALRPSGRQPAASSRWGRLLGLAAAAVVVALLATVLVQQANQRGRTTGPVASPVPSQTQPTATVVPATATPTHPAGAVVTAPIDTVTMISATSGWGKVHSTSATYDHQIAYTVDGGHTWYDVTPPGLASGPLGSIVLYPLSSTQAWAWTNNFPISASTSTTLWHTTDAGAHWSSYTVATGAVMQLDFIDATHGWLAATPNGSAAGQMPIVVWRTVDGGRTWTDIASTPVRGHTTGISFVNATTGFATSYDEASSALLISVTHDAGVTWTPVALPAPSTGIPQGTPALISPPIFTSTTAGVLEVTYGSVASSPAILNLYRTADAGATWQLEPALSGTSETSGSIPCSVLGNGDVLAALSESGQVTLYRLPLGTTSWTTIQTGGSSVRLLSGITQLNMVNQTTGWAVTSAGLIGTTDGGVIWTVLHA